MASASFVEVVITCASWQEAQTIADTLLEKRLIASAEFIDGTRHEDNEVKLIMPTRAEQCSAIAATVKKLRNPTAPAIRMVPMTDVSPGTAAWLEDEIK